MSEAKEEESDDPNANKLPESPKLNVQKRLAASHSNNLQLGFIGGSDSKDEQSRSRTNKKAQNQLFRQPVVAHSEELKT